MGVVLYGSFSRFVDLTRKWVSYLTAAFCVFAFCPRNRAVDFTAAFHDFGFCPRKLALYFTAAFSRYGFCRRKWVGRVLLNGLLFTAPYVGLCFIGRIIKKLKKH